MREDVHVRPGIVALTRGNSFLQTSPICGKTYMYVSNFDPVESVFLQKCWVLFFWFWIIRFFNFRLVFYASLFNQPSDLGLFLLVSEHLLSLVEINLTIIHVKMCVCNLSPPRPLGWFLWMIAQNDRLYTGNAKKE